MVPGNTEKERELVEHVGQTTSEEGSSKPAIITATALGTPLTVVTPKGRTGVHIH